MSIFKWMMVGIKLPLYLYDTRKIYGSLNEREGGRVRCVSWVS